MKAIICKKYGGPEVLKMEEVPKPIPNDSEVCIKIHATSVTNSDIFIRGSKLPFPIIIPVRLAIGLDWKWLADWCEFGVSLSADYGFWGSTPWNYSHPYWENWSNVAWYKKVNGSFIKE